MNHLPVEPELLTKEKLDKFLKELIYSKNKPRQIWNGKLKRYVDYKQR